MSINQLPQRILWPIDSFPLGLNTFKPLLILFFLQSTVKSPEASVIRSLCSLIYCYQECYLVLPPIRLLPFFLIFAHTKKYRSCVMKLPFKLIATLVVISLLGIFVYQAYWLTGLYSTMKHDMEQNIMEAMRVSDYNEMMLRIEAMQQDNDSHGEIEVSAGYDSDAGKSYVRSSTTIDRTDTLAYESREDTIGQEMPQAALHTNGGLDLILRDQSSMLELATYFQRGLHSGLDIVTDPNIAVYDSLLNRRLLDKDISLPYLLEYVYISSMPDSSHTYIDTIATAGTPGYIPTPKAKQYNYAFNIHSNRTYRLTIEPVNRLVLQQMSGILATSFIILIILSFSFWFLIRTILRQKTLEEMKSDFTNNVTHELKTPIAVAYAANDALLNFNLAEDKKHRDKYLNICQEQLQRLSGLVEQILSMSMERRKTFRLHPEALRLHDLFPPLIEQHKLKAGKPTNFTLNVEPEDLTVTADRTHFSNILSNLIDNAIKYSPEQANITICCRQTEVEQVEVSVADHGIGIPADKQAHVFDKFYRVPTGNIHNTKGFGLGLFYVKTMVEKHGGSVTVKSEPGKGSTFTLLI